MPTGAPRSQTVADVLAFLGLDPRSGAPRWPPDAFAAAVLLLQRSDTYRLAVERWPPGKRPDWVEFIEEVGSRWRAAATDPAVPLPSDESPYRS